MRLYGVQNQYFCKHNMAGIYIHIPFCRKACHYCNFHFSTSVLHHAEMMQAIGKEAVLRKNYLTEPVTTIYFGGGTPSLLPVEEIGLLIGMLKDTYLITNDSELTLEANPDDITTEKLAGWKKAGINRLSIGIQSFREEDLKWMNRAHTASQAKNCILLAQEAGFDNLTVDLIYGTPGLSDDDWLENIQFATALGVPHLSCYALTVEPKTALAKKIDMGQLKNVDPDIQARHFSILTKTLAEKGYEHYEISNFAKPGFRSRHNSSYWQGVPYLGLGPSAHSFNGKSRQWNIANNALYLSALTQNNIPFEEEVLTPQQMLNEYIMTSLRTIEGLSPEKIQDNWGKTALEELKNCMEPYLRSGKIVGMNGNYCLSEEGRFLADGIAADLFQL